MNAKFLEWFKEKVMQPDFVACNSARVMVLGKGPNKRVRKLNGLSINGFKFRTISREIRRVTLNCGVLTNYGNINDIIEINYSDTFKVMLFKCDSVDVHRNIGMRKDVFGFTLVNFSHLIYMGDILEHDPYVFSSQVEQVFYLQDPAKDPTNVN